MNTKKRLYTETVFAFINYHFPGSTIYEGIILNPNVQSCLEFTSKAPYLILQSELFYLVGKEFDLSGDRFYFICNENNLFGL